MSVICAACPVSLYPSDFLLDYLSRFLTFGFSLLFAIYSLLQALQTSSSSGSSLPLDESTHRLYRYQEMGDSYGSNLDLPCIEEQADDFQGLDHK